MEVAEFFVAMDVNKILTFNYLKTLSFKMLYYLSWSEQSVSCYSYNDDYQGSFEFL
jgi:hypothetical protein